MMSPEIATILAIALSIGFPIAIIIIALIGPVGSDLKTGLQHYGIQATGAVPTIARLSRNHWWMLARHTLRSIWHGVGLPTLAGKLASGLADLGWLEPKLATPLIEIGHFIAGHAIFVALLIIAVRGLRHSAMSE